MSIQSKLSEALSMSQTGLNQLAEDPANHASMRAAHDELVAKSEELIAVAESLMKKATRIANALGEVGA